MSQQQTLVLTLISDDRPGLVELLAAAIAEHGGSWQQSSMSQLAGKFAGILLILVDREHERSLVKALRDLEQHDMQLTIEPAGGSGFAPEDDPGRRSLGLEFVGHDRPGIVRDVATALRAANVNVESLETDCTSAPMTGEPMFRAVADLAVPGSTDLDKLRDQIEKIADQLGLDLSMELTLGRS